MIVAFLEVTRVAIAIINYYNIALITIIYCRNSINHIVVEYSKDVLHSTSRPIDANSRISLFPIYTRNVHC